MVLNKQLFAIAFIAKAPALLSIISSFYVIQDILRLKERKKYLHIRIFLWIHVCTSSMSIFQFVGTWAIPRGTTRVVAAYGNEFTCNLQGFFLTFGLSGSLYYCVFAILCYISVRSDFQRLFSKQEEYLIHAFCSGCPFILAVIGLQGKYLAPAGPWCFVDSSPPGCEASPDVDCITQVPTYYRSLLLIFSTMCLFSTITILLILYCRVRKDEKLGNDRDTAIYRKSRVIILQGMLFVLTYGTSYFLLTIARLYQWIYGEMLVPVFGMAIFLTSSQGFFNMVLYAIFKNAARPLTTTPTLQITEAEVIEDVPVATVLYVEE